jgi:hypothetical protein
MTCDYLALASPFIPDLAGDTQTVQQPSTSRRYRTEGITPLYSKPLVRANAGRITPQ